MAKIHSWINLLAWRKFCHARFFELFTAFRFIFKRCPDPVWKHRSITRIILITTLISLAVLFPPNAAAQQLSITKIQITNIDSSAFPNMVVQALIRDVNDNPVPADDISKLELLENWEPVAFQHQLVKTGVEVIFVFDIGLGASVKSQMGEKRLGQMKEIVKTYIATMIPEDTIGLQLVTSEGVSIPQPVTTDATELLILVDQLSANSSSYSKGLDGVRRALNELTNTVQKGHVNQSIVFITSSIESNTGDAQKIIEQAVRDSVSIHTILVREDSISQEDLLQKIAAETHGLYVHYTGEASLKSVFDWLSKQRTQYQFLFHSKLNTSSERTLHLQTKENGAGLVVDSGTFQVMVLPPIVEINQPANNTEFVRKASTYSQDLDQVAPSHAKVTARVDWPDGHPRSLKEAVFWLDNTMTSNPLVTPSPENITFDWDLRPYRSSGSNPAQLQVSVIDEFGLQSRSAPVQVKVIVIPALPAKEPEPIVSISCNELEGFALLACQARYMFSTPAGWISMISMLVAIGAVILVIHYRWRIADAGGAAFEVMRSTLRLESREENDQAGAYLEVLRGEDTLTGKKIPLYFNKTILAGRSPQESELVFDMTNRRSVVSRRHCEFRGEVGLFKIRDLGSTHGTFINGVRLSETGEIHLLSEGDRIELGPIKHGGILLVFHNT